MKDISVDLIVEKKDGEQPLHFSVNTVGIAMFCDRGINPEVFMEEQREWGWERICEEFPSFCKISRYLLTTDKRVEVQGNQTCGEVEVVALAQGADLFIGIGSDHCDRAVEPSYFYKPKQMCPHAVGPRVWRYEEVADHWDELEMISSMLVDGEKIPFQKGSLSSLMKVPDLIERSGYSRDGLALYCGTVKFLGDYIFGDGFEIELRDPVLGRSLRHTYALDVLNDLA